MDTLKKILLPFSYLYGLGTELRNNFFDKGALKSFKVDVPVISVGNITSGGTGKTPVTLYLAKYFLDRGKKTGIISRGYGRRSKNMEIVHDGKKLLDDINKTGDELLMLAEDLKKNYNNFYIIAEADRVSAAKHMTNKFPVDIIILDDAFQHRYIKRDLDIVVIDAEDYYKEPEAYNYSLPSGKLREKAPNIERSDIIIQNNKSGSFDLIPFLKDSGKAITTLQYKPGKFIGKFGNLLKGFQKEAIVFSGIGSPESFHKILDAEGVKMKEKIVYDDHHKYVIEDIQRLMRNYDTEKIYITTQKDFTKVKKFKNFIDNYPVYYLNLELFFEKNYNILVDKLEELIKPA